MTTGKDIHFGNFVRAKRNELGLTLKEFGAAVGVTEKRVWDIERMAVPKVNERTMYGVARAVGMKIEQLEHAWKTTPARRPTKRKSGISGSLLRTLRLPAEVLAGLEYLAGKRTPKQSVAEYLTEHVADRGYKLTISRPNPGPGRHSSAASPTVHNHE